MKWIKYEYVCGTDSDGAEILAKKRVGYSDANLVIAEAEAYNGEYTIEEDDKEYPSEATIPADTDMQGFRITNLGDPIDDTDAASKKYADTKVDKEGITLGIHTDGLVYAFVDDEPVGTGVEFMAATGDVVGWVDSANNIVLTGNIPDGTYTLKYEKENGEQINVGNLVVDSNVYYLISVNCTNCTCDNNAIQVISGSNYEATIAASDGYKLDSVVVTMSGVDVTSDVYDNLTGIISIENVIGNVVITAVASVLQGNLADPTSADWLTDSRLASGYGYAKTLSGCIFTNYIPAKRGDVLRVKGLGLKTLVGTTNSMIGMYLSTDTTADSTGKLNAYKGFIATSIGSSISTEGVKENVTQDGDVYTYTLGERADGQYGSFSFEYIRISAPLADGYTADDVVITINEPIE